MQSFAFDLGTNSIGWCVLRLDAKGLPDKILDAGARIFSDGREPKSGNSLAEGRRVARGMARRRDRYKRRRKAVLRTLTEYSLMPADQKARKELLAETSDRSPTAEVEQALTDVYNLRARALSEKLPLYHIGRALFHLNQRRGFKSNRKADRKSKDNEKGAIALGTERLHLAIKAADAKTLGQFLAIRRGSNPSDWGSVRVRAGTSGEGDETTEKAGYAFYPERSLLIDEFNQIWRKQADFYPNELTEERRAHLFDVMFYQRPLKATIVGRCSFNPDELRLAKAHPLFQAFRLHKEVNELELVMPEDLSHRKLDLSQRDALVHHLKGVRKATFKSLMKTLNLSGRRIRFNKESETRLDMLGDEVSAVLADKKAFGNRWAALTIDEQWTVVERLRDEQDTLVLHNWLMVQHGLTPSQAGEVANARLPEGYGRLGRTAMQAMLEELQAEVIPEAEAAKRAGYDHALARKGDGVDELPNYQEILERRIPPGTGVPADAYDVRMGRITNPTVHIALNQLRTVVNGLIRRYGKPHRIHIELARDLNQSEEQKREANKRNAKNRRDAELRSEILRQHNQADNGFNRQLLKQWEELNPSNPLDRCCIYSGTVITPTMLFSGAVDIDHILPWSRTLDDSPHNRLLCTRESNRQKGNNAPAEVPQWMAHYEEILERAARLNEKKRWRFANDAMARFEKDRDFLDRQLTDTQYLARLAHDYLGALYPDEEADGDGVIKRRNHVVVVTGKMTEMLRRKWGLNGLLPDHNYPGAGGIAQAKNRKDHRHHAIDAAIIGVISRSLLKKIADAAREGEEQGAENAIRSLPLPWETFRGDLQAVVNGIVVSHKPDHGTLPKPGETGRTVGQLHNDTAYGITGELDERGNTIVVRRKSFLSLTEKDIPSVRDVELRARLEDATSGQTGKEFTLALGRFQQADQKFRRVRHVRVTESLSVIPICDSLGHVYKGYKGDANYRYDVWELPGGKWVADVVTMFDAHRPNQSPESRKPHPAARKVLSLKQNDMVAYEHPTDGLKIGIIVKFGQNGQVTLVPHNEAGDLKKRDSLPVTEEEALRRLGALDVEKQPEFDPFKYYSPTAGGLKKIKLRQVRIDETGLVFDPGPQDRQVRLARRAAIGR